jgi:subtilisin family serine protease
MLILTRLKLGAITTGGLTVQGDTIVVAVIDCGADITHEDLNFWKNYLEIPGNGIDDDTNGYVDDFDGWNAQSQTGVITSCSHGTHVSGIIGAIGNNTTGVVGVNWNVKIMPVQPSSTNEALVVAAYTYVYNMRRLYNQTNGAKGAFIVATNSSFGVNFRSAGKLSAVVRYVRFIGQCGNFKCRRRA